MFNTIAAHMTRTQYGLLSVVSVAALLGLTFAAVPALNAYVFVTPMSVAVPILVYALVLAAQVGLVALTGACVIHAMRPAPQQALAAQQPAETTIELTEDEQLQVSLQTSKPVTSSDIFETTRH